MSKKVSLRFTSFFNKVFKSAILMSWIKDFVRIGSPLFVVPLVLLNYTETEQNFFWLIGTFFSFVLVADAGISSVMVRATAYFKSGADAIPKTKKEFDAAEELHDKAPNYQRIVELFQTSRWLYLILTAVLFILLSTAGTAAVWNLMSLDDHSPDMWAAYGVLVLYFTVYMLNIRWSSLMRGLDFVAAESLINTIITSIRIAVWIIVLSLGLRPLALTCAMLGEGIVTHLAIRIYINRWFKSKNLKVKSGRFNKTIFFSMWPAAWRQGGIQLGNFLVERGNSIIILQIPDSGIMSNFNFTIWILKTIFTFSLTPVYSRLPVLYKWAAEKKMDLLKKSAAGYMFLGLSLIAVGYLMLGAFGNYVLGFTPIETRLIVPIGLFIIMALTEFLDLNSSFHAGVYTSTNHIPFFWPSIISGAIIFSIGMFVMLPIYETKGTEIFLVGLIFTRFVVQLSFNNWFAMFLNLRLLNWNFFQFLVDVPKYGFRFVIDKAKEFLPGHKS